MLMLTSSKGSVAHTVVSQRKKEKGNVLYFCGGREYSAASSPCEK
jgi:hypothetical protein